MGLTAELNKHLPYRGGTHDDIARFSTWFFQNCIDATDDQEEDDMLVGIESVLYQWADSPHADQNEVIRSIWREVDSYLDRQVTGHVSAAEQIIRDAREQP